MDNALADYLRALTTRCEQATKGPWTTEIRHLHVPPQRNQVRHFDDHEPHDSCSGVAVICESKDSADPNPNLEFIAAAREDLPTLVRLVRDAHTALGLIAEYRISADEWPLSAFERIRAEAREALARAEAMVKEGG